MLPCWRLAVFPSIVKEASPLVFAEALAAGVLPMGADHSGLRDGLDDLAAHLPPAIIARMRIATPPERRVASLADNVTALLDELDRRALADQLRQIAVDGYDWQSVAARLAEAADAVRQAAIPR
jgi:glycosyltransferase involved in cell wall biosynthesis